MVISHNVPALFTHLSMRRSDRGVQQAMQRLSSGLRINSAREDAAGLAIANKLNYQVGGLRRASENSTHGISLIQTAEGALGEIHNMLQRMRELSVQAAHGTLTPQNREMIQEEIDQLTREIHSISRNTEYNRMRILNGEANRVIDNTTWDGAQGLMQLTRNIVSTLFVSHHVQPGHLSYAITEAGRPAMIPLSPLEGLIDPNAPGFDIEDPATWVPGNIDSGIFPPNTALTINGTSFNISGQTWSQVRGDLNAQLRFSGITLYEGTGANAGNFFLVTNLAGADHNITISGNLELFGHMEDAFNVENANGDLILDSNGDPILVRAGDSIPFGATLVPALDAGGEPVQIGSRRVYDQGRDARISFGDQMIPNPAFDPAEPIDPVLNPEFIPLEINGAPVTGGLFDENGQLVPGSSLGYSIDGNYVILRGSRGEDIRFNVQVMFNPEAGEFQLPNGMPIADIDGEIGINMQKNFRAFGPIMLQIGPSHSTAMPVQIPRLNAETLGLVQYVGGVQRMIIDVRPTAVLEPGGGVRQVGAERALNLADDAIQTVSRVRARLGAYQNRLESTVRNLDVAAENTEISRSRIQDTDMARETTRFAQYNVMFQAAMSILSQANQRPQQIIQLLQ